MTSWVRDDASGCAGSGAMDVHYVNGPPNTGHATITCVRVRGRTSYDFGMWVKGPGSGRGHGSLQLFWMRNSDCMAPESVLAFGQDLVSTGVADWTLLRSTEDAPAGAQSAQVWVSVGGAGNRIIVDQIYVTPAVRLLAAGP